MLIWRQPRRRVCSAHLRSQIDKRLVHRASDLVVCKRPVVNRRVVHLVSAPNTTVMYLRVYDESLSRACLLEPPFRTTCAVLLGLPILRGRIDVPAPQVIPAIEESGDFLCAVVGEWRAGRRGTNIGGSQQKSGHRGRDGHSGCWSRAVNEQVSARARFVTPCQVVSSGC
jgi:hypothetical protein